MRHRLPSLLSIAALAVTLAACQRDHGGLEEHMNERFDKLEKQIADLKASGGVAGKGAAARGDRPQRPRPKPDVTYSIPVDKAPTSGPKNALVTIVWGSEFACPYCEQMRPVMDQLLEDYPKDVRIAYKNYVVHPPIATIPALAGCAAAKQGKYTAMEPLIWDKGFKANRNLSAENMETLAGEAGLNLDKFKSDMNGEECKRLIKEDQAQLAAVGVSGTPAFYINGRWLPQRSPEGFKALIDEELKKARERVAQGTKPERYYEEWVVAKGEKKL
jgi:protein-disulfide isomerase